MSDDVIVDLDAARKARSKEEDIPNSNEIVGFMHCGLCLDEIKDGTAGYVSPGEYARFSVGWTPQGIQIWCVRHDCNVMHMDFGGVKHSANTTRKKQPGE